MSATAQATRVPKSPVYRDLREGYVHGTEPHKVDREKCIIYGVLVCGKHSPNTHGEKGVEGTDYEDGALIQGLPLYEGLMVNIDHPPREKPGRERSAHDRFGKLVQARISPEGTRADLHYLKSHPMAERITEAAERMPDAFGLSHNAFGRGEVRNGRYVIVEIKEVRSVDVVADAGTTRSLFESQEPVMKKVKVRLFLEGLLKHFDAKKRSVFRSLLEDDAAYSDEMEMDEPKEGASPEEAMTAGFRAAVMAVFDHPELDLAAKKSKINDILKAHDKLNGGEEDEESEEEEEKPVKESEEPPCDPKDKKKKMEESKKPKTPKGPNLVQLREKCEQYCKLAGVLPDKALLEGLVAMRDESTILNHLDYLKANQVKRPAGAKSQAQRPLTESRQDSTTNGIPETTEGRMAYLRGAR